MKLHLKKIIALFGAAIYVAAFLILPSRAADDKPLNYDSETFEIIRGAFRDTIYLSGSVSFARDGEKLRADSAIWVKGESIILNGHVFVEDTAYQLSADHVFYDVANKLAYASGQNVVIFSAKDSLKAIGSNAYYSRDSALFRMSNRPTVFLNFPDSARMVRVDADKIALDAENKIGYADGQVIINQTETESRAGRAIMYMADDILTLYDSPVARRRNSEIKGDTLIAFSENSVLNKIYVAGNAEGNFKEPTGNDSTIFDTAELKSLEMEFNLEQGDLRSVVASGQAYSFYSPGTRDSVEIIKNNSSGDTIKLLIDNERLSEVQVIAGAEGEYLNCKYKKGDSGRVFVEDTVIYKSDRIDYTVRDSTIVMTGNSSVLNKNLSLTAHSIRYNTARELVTAYDDSIRVDTSLVYVPVILKDGSEELIGSYLEYSMNTERGMLRKSKTEYEKAYYRGRELFREKKDIYYVDNGSYTSCDAESPHYHFQSSKMKMMQGNKIIARPVVFYIEKLPIMIFPYYIFSIKPGRHSGFLPFRIGNFERGAGSISNVGYYWAASQYWDVQASLDYYENFGFAYHSSIRYNLRYNLSGSVTGSYANNSRYDADYREIRQKRWQLAIDHSQTISPTFNIQAHGNFISDKSYYTEFSTDLDERLNRDLRSQISISKQWRRASLSAQFIHTVALDREVRTDEMPTASISFPGRAIFGSPSKGEGKESERKWYQSLYFRYGAGLRNYSTRSTDSTGFRSRKEFLVVNHSPTLSVSPVTFFRYLRVGPSFSYQETWYKIFETDQSAAAGIDTKQLYRRFAYGASISAATDLYGTVSPNLWGLQGLRHVLTPDATFSWAPEITRHNEIRNYTGAGGGGTKQKTVTFSLRNIVQAKVKSGEATKTLNLFTVSSSFSYNFEASNRKFSTLSTNAQTSLARNLRISAGMTHDFYVPGTDQLRFWSPYLSSFNISTSFSTSGSLGEYEAATAFSPKTSPQTGTKRTQKQNWSMTVSHYYSENGRGNAFTKAHSVSMAFNINLTTGWKLNYTQSYDFVRGRTVSRRIEVERNLHCWQGYFYWIPDGSNRGYYFRINVISLPDIKFEKSESGIKGLFGR